MKRLYTAALLALVCVSAWAVQIETGTNGQKVSTTNPLPVTGSLTVTASGTTTSVPYAWTTYTCSAVTVTSTSSNVASMAGRVFCAVVNIDPSTSIWINPGAGAAATGTGNIEIKPGEMWHDTVAASINVPMYASPTVAATVIQGK